MSLVRSFIALELPPHIVAALMGAGEALRACAHEWRDEKWVAEHNLHITLKFLGDVEEAELGALAEEAGAQLAHASAFSLDVRGIEGAPSHGRRSMVWATISDPQGRCAALATTVDSIAQAHGIRRDTRRFTPHVTLVRARKPRRLSPEALSCANEAVSGADSSMSVLSATLFASTLTRTGPVYEPIAAWSFILDPQTV